MVSTCEVIINGNSEYNEGWSVEDNTGSFNALLSFKFVFTVVALQHSLMYLKEAAVKLQGQDQDIASGTAIVEQCSCYKITRGKY